MKNSMLIRHCALVLILAFAPILGISRAWGQERSENSATGTQPATTGTTAELVPEEPEQSRRGQIVVFGQDVHLRKNETCRDLVVIWGDATIDGTVEGNAVVVLGSSKVAGRVDGDLFTILGSVNLNGKVDGSLVNVLGSPVLGPRALVERDVIAVCGKLQLDPRAVIRGMQHAFPFGEHFQWLIDWLKSGLFLARPLPPQLGWAWIVAGLFLLFYVLLAAVVPRPIQACVNALDDAPVAAFFVGLLSLILFLPLLVLLSITIVGIPLLFLSLVVAILLGKVAIYQFTGQQLARQLNLDTLKTPLVALLIGVMIFCLLYMIPIIGFLAWGAGLVWGVGAALMAVFANFKREGERSSGPVAVASDGSSLPLSNLPPPLEGSPGSPISAPADTLHSGRAGFWIRIGATIIDLLLIGIVSAIIGAGVSFPILIFAYHVAMWTWRGTTIGGIVFGLKVTRLDGRPIDFAVALVRSLFSIISFVFLMVGFFWAGWDKEKQSWHDKIAGTVIVTVPKGVSLL